MRVSSITQAALVLLGLLLFAAPEPAQAQSCSFSVSNVAFGQVDTLSGAASNTTATVSISCSGALLGAQARICLNLNAGNGGSSGSTRLMRSGSNPLSFQLYQDAARAIPWGSVEQPQFGQPVTVNLTLPLLGGTVSTTRTIYGRVFPTQQTAATGTYSSAFSGETARFNYAFYIGAAPACTATVANPIRPNFTATATVLPNCLVSAQDINFGRRGVLNTQVDAAGAIQARCTPGIPYTVGLSGGLSNAPPAQRQMTRSGRSVLYGLYRDSARTQIWGDASTNRLAGQGTGLLQSLPVYGRIPPQITPPAGTYSDTVVVTMRY